VIAVCAPRAFWIARVVFEDLFANLDVTLSKRCQWIGACAVRRYHAIEQTVQASTSKKKERNEPQPEFGLNEWLQKRESSINKINASSLSL
jgi:hypothetical protein